MFAKSTIFLTTIFLTSCATVSMANRAQSRSAKEFSPSKDRAKIYVYRNEVLGSAIKVGLALNGNFMGETAPGTFHMWEVAPGKHEVSCEAERSSRVTLNAQPEKLYFIWQEMKWGTVTAGCALRQVTEERGKSEISRCCDLASSGPLE